MELLSIKQLAARSGVSYSAIYQAIAHRQLAAIRTTPRGHYRVQWADFEAWIRRVRIPAMDEAPTRSTPTRSCLDKPGADRYAQ